jgi:hypothetical protein
MALSRSLVMLWAPANMKMDNTAVPPAATKMDVPYVHQTLFFPTLCSPFSLGIIELWRGYICHLVKYLHHIAI